MAKDVALGVISLAVAIAYMRAAAAIPTSMLSDNVGSAGFPTAIGWVLAGTGVVLIVQGLLKGAAAVQPAGEPGSPIVYDPLRTALRALGIVVIAAGFLFLLQIIGYVAALVFLIVTLSLYLGMRPVWRVGVVAVLGAVVLWVIFVLSLGIRLPAGFWPHLL